MFGRLVPLARSAFPGRRWVSTAEDLFSSRLQHLNVSFSNLKIPEEREANLQKAFNLYEAINHYQTPVYASITNGSTSPYIEQSNELLGNLLTSENVQFNAKLLQKILATQPPFPTLKIIIKSYYKRSPDAYIPASLANIPFRRLLWDGSFEQALDYIELTTANERYLNHRMKNIKRYLSYFTGSMFGTIGVAHLSILTFFPELITIGETSNGFGVYGLYACVATYFINCGFLAALSFSSKGMENGSLMFKHYTMPHHWYQKVESMKMASRILQADAAIHGQDGFATREIVTRIEKLGFDINEPEEEIMLRQYWVSSGEGFVWVEPDLDPAEIEWWNHLSDVGVKKVWDVDYEKLQADARDGDETTDDAELLLPDEK
ncbi:hypothetical protein DAMA08_019170 [Martiniozyma asiatica (nom. inval.)]|nr:hypothetical protein DAMA08_019170 [Martiniozyma asiatica]